MHKHRCQVGRTDAYPNYLCQECTNELLIAAKFRKKCAEAEKRLRDETSRINMDTAELVVAEEIIIFDPNDYKVEPHSPGEDGVEEPTEILSSNCRDCGAVFQLPAALRRHIEKVHTSVIIYDCEKCGGFFKNSVATRVTSVPLPDSRRANTVARSVASACNPPPVWRCTCACTATRGLSPASCVPRPSGQMEH